MNNHPLDTTAKFRKAARIQSAHEQLRTLTQNLTLLADSLREQHAILRQRGMNLPAAALERVKFAGTRVETLANTLTAQQIELRQLRALADTTALISSSLSTDEVLNQVMDTVVQLTGAERGYIMLKNKFSGEMEFRIARGIDREQLGRDDFMISNTIVNEVTTSGAPVLTDNARNDPRYQSQESIVGFQLRSILAVPLTTRGEVIGVVYCDNRVLAGLFKAHELNLLLAFANQAAVAIQNARLFESARTRLAEVSEIRDLMNNIFTSIASGLIALDPHNLITAYNPAAEMITGIKRDQAWGADVHDVLGALGDELDEKLRRVREWETFEEWECTLNVDGLGERHWNVAISPLSDADDPNSSSESVTIVLDDLTDLKQRESQLAQVRRYLPVALVENIRSDDLNIGGQEREVSLIFADVRGFTAFSESLQPEALMEVINKYLSAASDSINLFEGVVEKYIGDAVTGLFNSQLNPQTDHALRAVRAALSMVYDVVALHETLAPDHRLFYGVAVHTGMAVMGNVGSAERREFAAMGEAVELLKLLQENAARGEVLISASTYALINQTFECEALEPRINRGRADFTVMYKITGRKKRNTGILN